eukprot:734294-Prymnesium_polylepis.1
MLPRYSGAEASEIGSANVCRRTSRIELLIDNVNGDEYDRRPLLTNGVLIHAHVHGSPPVAATTVAHLLVPVHWATDSSSLGVSTAHVALSAPPAGEPFEAHCAETWWHSGGNEGVDGRGHMVCEPQSLEEPHT